MSGTRVQRWARLAGACLALALVSPAVAGAQDGAQDDLDPGYVNRAMGIGEPREPAPFTREQRLLHAVRTNDRATVLRALELGVSVDARDDLGRSALLLAVRDARDLDLVKLLHERGAAIDTPDAGGRTPLSWAAARGRLDLVRYLLAEGASVDRADAQGRTPLFYAAIGDHADAVRLLAERGAAIDVADRREETPLIGACAKQAGAAARVLLDLGADPTRTDRRGRTAGERARGRTPVCGATTPSGA